MTYSICESCLLFPVDLSRGECAAWVQAIGSILAITVAIGIAIYQSNKQQEITRNALLEQQRQLSLGVAKTLSELAKQSLKIQSHFTSKLNTRDAVYDAVKSKIPYDMTLLYSLENSLSHIQLHKLPSNLVSLCLILTTHIQQLRLKIDNVLNVSRLMQAKDFDDLFTTLQQMEVSLTATVNDFNKAFKQTENA